MSINRSLNNLDEALNHYGEIPVVSTLSGSCRIAVGLIETIIGIAKAIIGIFAAFGGYPDLLESANDDSLNGIFNILRGAVEVIPIIGNIAMVCLNRASPFEYSSVITRTTVRF